MLFFFLPVLILFDSYEKGRRRFLLLTKKSLWLFPFIPFHFSNRGGGLFSFSLFFVLGCWGEVKGAGTYFIMDQDFWGCGDVGMWGWGGDGQNLLGVFGGLVVWWFVPCEKNVKKSENLKPPPQLRPGTMYVFFF